MNNQAEGIRYYVTTYSYYSHNHLINVLSSLDALYKYDVLQSEEVYSKFVVESTLEAYNTIKQLMENNDGTAISIEYGPY